MEISLHITPFFHFIFSSLILVNEVGTESEISKWSKKQKGGMATYIYFAFDRRFDDTNMCEKITNVHYML